ncbi:GGDEF domain-containing protein [Sphingomonas sp. OK281]|uniref:GGDEF domain-containing protein n=1 Tax=Sphingomonas sp. OK281 TaxID=1881067 RepID=UPI0034A21EE5
MTGLANRRAFDIALAGAWLEVRLSRTQMSLLLIGVDFSKEFNDAYGHQTGDAWFRAISTALQGLPLAAGDVVGRYGGEELAVILHRSCAAEAVEMAGLACDAVHCLQLPHRQPPYGGWDTDNQHRSSNGPLAGRWVRKHAPRPYRLRRSRVVPSQEQRTNPGIDRSCAGRVSLAGGADQRVLACRTCWILTRRRVDAISYLVV